MNSDLPVTPMIREAAITDAGWYVDHVRALAAEPGAQIPLRVDEYLVTPEQQAETIHGAAERGDLFLIAEVDGVPMGEINLRRGLRAAFQHSVVVGMSVAPAWRNRRIGSALMLRALEWARAQDGLRRVELWVYATNTNALRLYERHGFVVEGRRRGAVRVGDGYVDDMFMAHYLY